MKALVGAFNQEKALVGAFSVITNLRMELFEALVDIESVLVNKYQVPSPRHRCHAYRKAKSNLQFKTVAELQHQIWYAGVESEDSGGQRWV